MRVLYALVPISLTGCGMAQDNICAEPWPVEVRMEAQIQADAPATEPSVRVFATKVVADACITQRARQLAPSNDSAIEIARAATVHCSVSIQRQIAAQKAADQASGNTSPVRSETTGRETTLEAYSFGHYEREALARVVEARAGDCKPIK